MEDTFFGRADNEAAFDAWHADVKSSKSLPNPAIGTDEYTTWEPNPDTGQNDGIFVYITDSNSVETSLDPEQTSITGLDNAKYDLAAIMAFGYRDPDVE